MPRRCSKILVVGDYLYAFGGYDGTFLDTIERARINADGSLGKWELLPEHFITPRYIHTMAHIDKALYAIGGHAEQSGAGMESSEFASVKSDGSLGSWKVSASLKQGRYGLMSVVHDGYVYAMGGLNGATFYDVIERSSINDDGSLGEWQNIAPLPTPFADVGVATYKNWLYVLGGTNRDGYYNQAFYARAAALAPSKPLFMPNEGNVAQVIDGGVYLYIEIDFGDGNRCRLSAGSCRHRASDDPTRLRSINELCAGSRNLSHQPNAFLSRIVRWARRAGVSVMYSRRGICSQRYRRFKTPT